MPIVLIWEPEAELRTKIDAFLKDIPSGLREQTRNILHTVGQAAFMERAALDNPVRQAPPRSTKTPPRPALAQPKPTVTLLGGPPKRGRPRHLRPEEITSTMLLDLMRTGYRLFWTDKGPRLRNVIANSETEIAPATLDDLLKRQQIYRNKDEFVLVNSVTGIAAAKADTNKPLPRIR